MKNKKKILAALICISTFIAAPASFASEEDSLNELNDKEDIIKEQEDLDENEPELEEEPEVREEKEPSEDNQEDGLSYEEQEEETNKDPKSLERVRVPYQRKSEEITEDLDEVKKENLGLEISEENVAKAQTVSREKDLPIVYYDASNLDEILKKYPEYVRKNIKPSGDYSFVKQGEDTYIYGKDGKLLESQTIISKDKIYRTDARGKSTSVTNSWAEINDDHYRLDSKGKVLKGFNRVDNKDFYFDNSGVLLRNAFINQDRTMYRADDRGVLSKAKNTWAKVGSKTFLTDSNARTLAGKRNISGTDYYFSKKDGLIRNNEVLADGGRYWANDKGALSFIKKERGWHFLDGLNYRFEENGKLSKGLTDSGKYRYFFDLETGEMLRNQIIKKGFDKIYLAQNGVANYVGWDYYNGRLSFNRENGTFAKGLSKIDGVYYGFDDNGKIYDRQYKKINGQWWYFNKFGEASRHNGNFARGWVGDRYYFQDGKPAEGLQVINGKTYIFHERTRNKIRNDIKVVNFNKYKLDSNGVARKIGRIDTRPAIMGTRGQFAPGFSQYFNRKTPYFRQVDPRWSYRRFSAGTLGEYGCGPTVMAMVLNKELHRNDIYPTNTAVDAADYDEYGTDWQYFKENPRIYGLNSYDVTINEKALIQALEFGSVIMRVGAGYYTTGGHYIVIDSYKDGYFTINDPYSLKNTREKQPFWRIKQEATVAWVIKK